VGGLTPAGSTSEATLGGALKGFWTISRSNGKGLSGASGFTGLEISVSRFHKGEPTRALARVNAAEDTDLNLQFAKLTA
jgi:hypothetical protein